MKATVINPFICKIDRKQYKVGNTYEANKERIDELAAKGKVKPIVEPAPIVEPVHVPKAEVKKPKKDK